ncbi:hypothetical protein D3C71_1935730 [compost metagenome]
MPYDFLGYIIAVPCSAFEISTAAATEYFATEWIFAGVFLSVSHDITLEVCAAFLVILHQLEHLFGYDWLMIILDQVFLFLTMILDSLMA